MRKIVLRSIPLLLAAILIFGLTMQDTNDNVELSEKCRLYAVRVAEHFDIDTEVAWWNSPGHFRRIGHIIEYFFLGIGVCYAIRKPYVSFVICMVVSYLDQYLKSKLPIRHFDIFDIPFDALGCGIGILITWTILRVFSSIVKQGVL